MMLIAIAIVVLSTLAIYDVSGREGRHRSHRRPPQTQPDISFERFKKEA